MTTQSPSFAAASHQEYQINTPRKRKPFSAATRKRMAVAQKQRWAAKPAGD